MASPGTAPAATEQRLLTLCRRLLRQNEAAHADNQALHAQIDRLLGIIHFLGEEYRALLGRLDRADADHGVIQAAADAMLAAAFDEHGAQGEPR